MMPSNRQEADFEQEVELDEGSDHWPREFKLKTCICFVNTNRKRVVHDSLYNRLSGIRGLDRVSTIRVEESSTIQDLRIAQLFPYCQNICVYGEKFRTVDGINSCGRVVFLEVDTGKNIDRDINGVGSAPIRRIFLRYGNPADISAICECAILSRLTIAYGPQLSWVRFRDIPLEYIQIYGGGMHFVQDASVISSLRSIHLYGCHELEYFQGENSRIDQLIVQNCGRLRLSSLQCVANIKSLTVTGAKAGVVEFCSGEYHHLKEMSFLDCREDISKIYLQDRMPCLEKVFVSNMRMRDLREFSALNPNVRVSNNTKTFMNGEKTEELKMPQFKL